MIEIRRVKENEIYKTAVIYVDCWRSDYKHFVPEKVLETFNVEKEAEECKEWLYEECDDKRLIYCAFINDFMVGYVTASKNSEEPKEYDTEINGLFVRKDYRGKGISLKLLYCIVEELKLNNFSKVLLYNFKDSYSNEYYRKLNGEVIQEITQSCGGKELDIDIFGWKLDELGIVIKKKMEKYL